MSGEAKSQTVITKKPRSVPRSNFNPLLNLMGGERRPTRNRLRSARPIRKTKLQILREQRAAKSQDSEEDDYSDDVFEDDDDYYDAEPNSDFDDVDETGGEEKREPQKPKKPVAVARATRSISRKLDQKTEELKSMTRSRNETRTQKLKCQQREAECKRKEAECQKREAELLAQTAVLEQTVRDLQNAASASGADETLRKALKDVQAQEKRLRQSLQQCNKDLDNVMEERDLMEMEIQRNYNRIDGLRQKLEEAQSGSNAQDKRLRKTLKDCRDDLEKERAENQRLQGEILLLEAQSGSNAQDKRLRQSLQQCNKDLDNVMKEKDLMEMEIQRNYNRIDGLRQKLEEAQSGSNAQDKRLRKTLKDCRDDLEEKRAENQRLQGKILLLEGELEVAQSVTAQQKRLTTSLKQCEDAREELQNNFDEEERKLQELELNHDTLKKQDKRLRSEVKRLNEELENRGESKHSEEDWQELSRAQSQLSRAHKALKKALAQTNRDFDKARNELEESKRKYTEAIITCARLEKENLQLRNDLLKEKKKLKTNATKLKKLKKQIASAEAQIAKQVTEIQNLSYKLYEVQGDSSVESAVAARDTNSGTGDSSDNNIDTSEDEELAAADEPSILQRGLNWLSGNGAEADRGDDNSGADPFPRWPRTTAGRADERGYTSLQDLADNLRSADDLKFIIKKTGNKSEVVSLAERMGITLRGGKIETRDYIVNKIIDFKNLGGGAAAESEYEDDFDEEDEPRRSKRSGAGGGVQTFDPSPGKLARNPVFYETTLRF